MVVGEARLTHMSMRLCFSLRFYQNKGEALLFTLETWLFIPLLCPDLPAVARSSTLWLKAAPSLGLAIDPRKISLFLASKCYLWSREKRVFIGIGDMRAGRGKGGMAPRKECPMSSSRQVGGCLDSATIFMGWGFKPLSKAWVNIRRFSPKLKPKWGSSSPAPKSIWRLIQQAVEGCCDITGLGFLILWII